jgi:hypothetical protein
MTEKILALVTSKMMRRRPMRMTRESFVAGVDVGVVWI